MRKLFLLIIVVLLILIASVYLFIPNFISISQSLPVNANRDGIYRSLQDEKNWDKWWPEKRNNKTGHLFSYRGFYYSLDDRRVTSITVSISKNNTRAITNLDLVSINADSANIVWQGVLPTSYNLIKRFQKYMEAKRINNDMSRLLKNMQSFFSKPENIYGFTIRQEPVVDSILVSTFAMSKGYPSTAFIYNLLDQLKDYIKNQSAKETGYPMLNINTEDSINYLTRVAIPVDKELKSSGNISYKRMLGRGKILVAEVKGGPGLINNAFYQMKNYVNDYQRVAPAIPFLSLVTDRMNEPDTSKWITRIYYPVM
jgi:hypothetical protein